MKRAQNLRNKVREWLHIDIIIQSLGGITRDLDRIELRQIQPLINDIEELSNKIDKLAEAIQGMAKR